LPASHCTKFDSISRSTRKLKKTTWTNLVRVNGSLRPPPQQESHHHSHPMAN
jgi:hypothetical protein